ncbi:MAG: GTPase Era [Bacteriovoracaceae bacterium]
MLLEDQYMHNRSIVVATLGAPNVGKSSLINHLLGFDLAIVSSKPQTTRNHYHCVFTVDHTEVVMIDTPGIHNSAQEINRRMNGQAADGSEGADLNLVLLDLSQDLLIQAKNFSELYKGEFKESWLIFTKCDLVDATNFKFQVAFDEIKKIIPSLTKYYVLSAKQGEGVNEFTLALVDKSAPGPHLYPGGDVSNKNERFFVTEYIREQAFAILKDELPYELAVVIDEYKDLRDRGEETKIASHISASILVNRPSQRAIVVGSQGGVIKEIGTRARKKIEAMVGGQVHLNLHVKVSPKWFKNNFILEEIGLPRVQGSPRVWRKK